MQSESDLEINESTTLPTNEHISPMITSDVLSTKISTNELLVTRNVISTTPTAILSHNSTISPNNVSLLSTENEYNNFDYREPTPPHTQIYQTTNMLSVSNSTKPVLVKNQTRLIGDLLNQSNVVRKRLPNNKQLEFYNSTFEEVAHHLSDRKLMQSLIHLIPPYLWSQIQQNHSIFRQNETQYIKPSLPDPVLLAEAAAQAGLPGPGPYPVPEHLWPRNPPQPVTRTTKTSE